MSTIKVRNGHLFVAGCWVWCPKRESRDILEEIESREKNFGVGKDLKVRESFCSMLQEGEINLRRAARNLE